MSKGLIIVESPSKAKTIRKLLPEYETAATLGHLLDLPENTLGLTIENGAFKGEWRYLSGKKKLMDELKEKASRHSIVYLAADEDREGEWIAQQVANGALKGKKVNRITFREITRPAILEGIANSRAINQNVVIAAQCRRFVDREIGYPVGDIIKFDFRQKETPFTPRGVGRAICPSLKILADNHERIENFIPEAYSQIAIDYSVGGVQFGATVKTRFMDKDKDELDATLYNIRNNSHVVSKYNEKTRDVAPYPPLVTARMVRSAYYLFGYLPKATMKLAQDLYEAGLITYMRTDSTRLCDEALFGIISLLNRFYGSEYVVQSRRSFEGRGQKGKVQGAHEAIRPTAFDDTMFPKNVRKAYCDLSIEHFKLYEFIWYRTIATQMTNAVYDASTAEIHIGDCVIVGVEANKLLFDGWTTLNGAMLKQAERSEDEDWRDMPVIIPRLEPGQDVGYVDLRTLNKLTKTPARFGVGRFVTEIESFTRPSTIDSIVDKLEKYDYIEIRKGMLYITELGLAITNWADENCPWLCDKKYTEIMEEALDSIEAGEADNPDSLLFEYHSLIEELKKKVGFVEREYWPSSEAQAQAVRRIGIKLGLSEDEIETAAKHKAGAETFLKKNVVARTKLGKCPECAMNKKSGDVVATEKAYSCSEYRNGCGFTLWKDRITKQFTMLGYTPLSGGMDEVIKRGLGRNPLYVHDLKGKSGAFEAAFVIQKDLKWGWQLALSFEKPKTKVSKTNAA